MPAATTTNSHLPTTPTKYNYLTIKQLSELAQPSGNHWCCYGVIKFCRRVNNNCMHLGICDPTSYGKGTKGASCLLYYESFSGYVEMPVEARIGQIIRLHRMKITAYRPESGCIQMKSANNYSWLLFSGRDQIAHQPCGQSSCLYSFSDEDIRKIDELRLWLSSFSEDRILEKELDFQRISPNSKRLLDRETQTMNQDEEGTSSCDNSQQTEFYSLSDQPEPPRKRINFSSD